MGDPNLFKQTPGRILLAFGITAALVAIYTAVDATRRGQEEGYDFPTALGDREWYVPAPGFDPQQILFTVDGEPFYQQKRAAAERYDKYMVKRGREDADRFYVYGYHNPRYGVEPEAGVLFVKVGDGRYLECGERPRDGRGGGDGGSRPEGAPPESGGGAG